MAQLPGIWRDMDRPFAQLSSWRPLLRQLDDFLSNEASFARFDGNRSSIVPACDIEETGDQFILSFDMPGIDKKDIDVQLHGNRLTVSAERKMEKTKGEGSSRFVERQYGRFERSITLPEGIKGEEVEAQYLNGVLHLAVPKNSVQRSHRIPVGDKLSEKFAVGAGRNDSKGPGQISMASDSKDKKAEAGRSASAAL